MRHHLEILKEIDTVLANEGLNTERRQLEDEIRTSSTGGELCSRSGFTLLVLQKKNKQVASSAGHLIKEFISYCKANGLQIKT